MPIDIFLMGCTPRVDHLDAIIQRDYSFVD